MFGPADSNELLLVHRSMLEEIEQGRCGARTARIPFRGW